MSRYNNMILTDAGRLLLARVQTGECDMEITRAEIGDGTYDEEGDISQATSLKNTVQSFGISSFEREGDQVLIRFIASNFDMPSGTGFLKDCYIREIGIYAEEKGTGNEILYAVATAQVPSFMPAYDTTSPVTITFSIYVYVGENDGITIHIDPTAYVISEVFYREKERLEASVVKSLTDANQFTREKIAELINGAPETLDTLKEVADALAENETVVEALDDAIGTKLDKTGDASEVTVAFEQASSRTNITSGEKLKTTLSKIKKWFADLKTVAFTGNYNDLTNKPTSLPASGGNADTVDNKHASAFLGNGTGYVCPSVNGGNANDYKSEFHGFVFNMSNVPDQGSTNGEYGYGFLDVSVFDGTGFQPATSGVIRQRFTAWKTAKEYVRTYQNGTWSSWRFVADNGGADSVLDVKDKRRTYMNYASDCVSDFIYFAVWNPNQPNKGNVELRAYNKENVASAIGVTKRSYGGILAQRGTVANGSFAYQDTDGHGHAHIAMTGISVSVGSWTNIARVTITGLKNTTVRGNVIVADGAYTLSGAERTGCTLGNNGEVSIISPVAFSGKDVYIDVFW